jgi:hypothetical protein
MSVKRGQKKRKKIKLKEFKKEIYLKKFNRSICSSTRKMEKDV